MAADTKIEWADHTFNPWRGCTKVSAACDHCYAERLVNGRLAGDFSQRVRAASSTWQEPRRWNRAAAREGKRARVFTASLADVFDNQVSPIWRQDLFELIRETPSLDWLLLTKRPQNIAKMLPPDWGAGYANVWLGTTVENQAEADRRIPHLLAVPAAKRFLSCEPLLGPVDISNWLFAGDPPCADCPRDEDCECGWRGRAEMGRPDALHWVIAGGESGPGARPMHPDWARSLRDQCAAAGLAFHFKQWGEWHTAAFSASTGEAVFRQFRDFQHWVAKATTWVRGGVCLDTKGRELKMGAHFARARDEGCFPVTIMHRVGKKAAGRLLDGAQHDGVPDA